MEGKGQISCEAPLRYRDLTGREAIWLLMITQQYHFSWENNRLRKFKLMEENKKISVGSYETLIIQALFRS